MMDQLTKDDTNYLYSIISDYLPYSMNPYKMVENLGAALPELIPQIQAERPELIDKFQKMQAIPVEELLAASAETGFPNR
jgi:hypothetical protein